MMRRVIVLEGETKRSGGEEHLWTPGPGLSAAMITYTI